MSHFAEKLEGAAAHRERRYLLTLVSPLACSAVLPGRNIMVLGSGFVTHNLREIMCVRTVCNGPRSRTIPLTPRPHYFPIRRTTKSPWAIDFKDWLSEVATDGRPAADRKASLAQWEKLAKNGELWATARTQTWVPEGPSGVLKAARAGRGCLAHAPSSERKGGVVE